MKLCCRCNIEKDYTEFHRDSRKKDGFKHICKQCRRDENQSQKDHIHVYHKQWYLKNKEKAKTTSRNWKKANPDRVVENNKLWRDQHRDELRLYNKSRYDDNINYKISKLLRSRISIALSRGLKSASAVKDLGCSMEEFKVYLESKFQPGMSWDNYSFTGWHIDHIIPLSSFDLTDPKQFKQACHYTNLQPLWAKDNLRKGSSLAANAR